MTDKAKGKLKHYLYEGLEFLLDVFVLVYVFRFFYYSYLDSKRIPHCYHNPFWFDVKGTPLLLLVIFYVTFKVVKYFLKKNKAKRISA